MSLLRSLSLGGAVLATITSVVLAADMPGLPLPAPAPFVPLRVEKTTGWYLRGDLGYRWPFDGSVEPAAGFPGPSSDKFKSSFMGGVGAGLKTNWLRTDVTIDYGSPMKYEGSINAPNDTTAKVSALTALFNGYLDLGSWYRASPYIGAGAGTARVSVSDYVSTASPPFSGDTSRTKWNFAWAAMAGVGYAVSPNAVIDVGYRYINFGDVTTASDAFGAMTLKNVAAHEVRVGLRWSFDDLHPVR
jgi:opacity protein-like surface antigen